MPKEKNKEVSPLNEDKRLKARQAAAEVIQVPAVAEQVALELDTGTAKLEIARARVASITEANIKELEATKELTKEEKEKAIAQQRVKLDQAERALEEHVEWRQYVRETYNI
jgi:hypothetical protein